MVRSTYSLDAIIAIGYRVSSARATKFRIWATKILNKMGFYASIYSRSYIFGI